MHSVLCNGLIIIMSISTHPLAVLARFWLLLLNLLFIAAGAFGVQVGFGLSRSVQQVANAVLVCSFLLLLTAMAGFGASLSKIPSFLRLFMAAVVVNLLTTLSCAIYSLFVIQGIRSHWMHVSEESWLSETDRSRDALQQALGCCGLNTIETAYTGPSTDIYDRPIANNCAQLAGKLSMPCQPRALQVADLYTRNVWIALVVSTAIFTTAIIAAYHSDKKRASLRQGFRAVDNGIRMDER